MAAGIERPQDQELQYNADDDDAGQRDRNGDEQRVGALRGFREEVTAEHEKRPVRQIDDAHDAEDQRDADGHQEKHHAELQPVEELLDENLQGHPRLQLTRGRRIGPRAACRPSRPSERSFGVLPERHLFISGARCDAAPVSSLKQLGEFP